MNLPDLEKSRQTFPEYAHNFILHNVNDPFPVPDNSFDIVFGVGILMYLINPQSAIEEAIRIARKKVIFAEFHYPEMDEVGTFLKVAWPPGKWHLGVARNYEKLFSKVFMGKKAIVTHSGLDKHIITYEKH